MGKIKSFFSEKFNIAILIGIFLVGLVAWIDIQGFNLLGDKYTLGDFPATVWPHHLITAIIIFLIPAILYWVFYRKDKSEFLAIFLTGVIMFYFGLADILYFFLQWKSIPLTLPWLMGNPFISRISTFLRFETVTNISLIISIIIGGVIVYFITKLLKKRF